MCILSAFADHNKLHQNSERWIGKLIYFFSLASIHYIPEPAEITKMRMANKIFPFPCPFSVPSEGCVRCGSAESCQPTQQLWNADSVVIILPCWAFSRSFPSPFQMWALEPYSLSCVSRITQGSWRINFMANPASGQVTFWGWHALWRQSLG